MGSWKKAQRDTEQTGTNTDRSEQKKGQTDRASHTAGYQVVKSEELEDCPSRRPKLSTPREASVSLFIPLAG